MYMLICIYIYIYATELAEDVVPAMVCSRKLLVVVLASWMPNGSLYALIRLLLQLSQRSIRPGHESVVPILEQYESLFH